MKLLFMSLNESHQAKALTIMVFTFEVLQDFFGTITFMALLAVGYGSVMRAFKRKVVAQIILGLLFGATAISAMLDPLHLTDGVIVDLRSVPVTLAGAFLGLPGAIVTILMAVAMRIAIGGSGMAAGTLGIVMAAVVGLIWTTFIRRPGYGVRNLLLLAGLSQLTLLASFLLPWAVTWQAMTTVWPVVVPLRFASVFVVAGLLKRERMMDEEAKQLGEAAHQDPLTGLLNRRGFEATVSRLPVPRQGSALLVLDLDHFKRVNDTHGHAAGDIVLQGLATRLRHAVRSEDVVARFGGEEVVVFLPNANARSAMDAAARICAVVRDQPFMLPHNVSVSVTTSVGGTWSNMIAKDKERALDAMLNQADAALYDAKADGRDCWRFDMDGRMTGSPADATYAASRQPAQA